MAPPSMMGFMPPSVATVISETYESSVREVLGELLAGAGEHKGAALSGPWFATRATFDDRRR